MDITKLERNASVIHNALLRQKNVTLVKQECRIYIPVFYQEKDLVIIANEIYIVGIFGIVVGNSYGISFAPAMLRILPTSYSKVKIEGDDYYEFYFESGAMLTDSNDVEKNSGIPYDIYDIFISGGKIPWYFTYLDLGRLFQFSEYFCNLRVGDNIAAYKMVVSTIARMPNDLAIMYRHRIERLDEVFTNPPRFIPYDSVAYNATNTTAKLNGNNFEQGLVSALINPSERNENIEDLLRQ